MQISAKIELESTTSTHSFSTKDSNIISFETFPKNLGKSEEPKTIEKFAILLKKGIY